MKKNLPRENVVGPRGSGGAVAEKRVEVSQRGGKVVMGILGVRGSFVDYAEEKETPEQ